MPSCSHDVLCLGHASFDLVFAIPHHPHADDKLVADAFLACGGGPAANAAVIVARLGLRAAFAGYLGQELYGDSHRQELIAEGVDVSLVVRGPQPTPLSVVLVKPDGARALVNYKGDTQALPSHAIDFHTITPKVILFDGHEPHLSLPLAERARRDGIITVLDAGSLHDGTKALMGKVDFLVASEKFARQWSGQADARHALAGLAELAPCVVITLGEHGLVWQRGDETGAMPAFSIHAIDTTGAGDAFHGAFAAGLAAGMAWDELLRYASAAGAWCCQIAGARPGMAYATDIHEFLALHPPVQ